MIYAHSLNEFMAYWPEFNKRALKVLKKDAIVSAEAMVDGRKFKFLINRPDKSHRDFLSSKLGIPGDRFSAGAFGIYDWETKDVLFSDVILYAVVDLIENRHHVKISDDASFAMFRVPQKTLNRFKPENVLWDFNVWLREQGQTERHAAH